MAIKLTITSSELLNKKFNNVPRGYDPFDVDEYLDKVIRDYRLVEANCLMEKKEIDKLEVTIKTLESKIKELEIENAKYEQRLKNIKDNKNVTIDNIDLIKRIRALETYIYRTGVNPNTIK